MPGLTNVLLAGGGDGLNRTLVVGAVGAPHNGNGFLDDPTGGTIGGSDAGSLDNKSLSGATIAYIGTASSLIHDLRVMIYRPGAAISQSFFTQLRIRDGAGTIRTFTSAAASFANNTHITLNDIGIWSFGGGASPVYQAGDVGDVRGLAFT
jgi:hypothetical protein